MNIFIEVHIHPADGANHFQEQLGNILQGVSKIMETLQSLNTKLDNITSQAAKEHQEHVEAMATANAKADAAITENTALKVEIQRLIDAGAGAITQADLDGLGTKADSALTAVTAVVDATVPQVQ